MSETPSPLTYNATLDEKGSTRYQASWNLAQVQEYLRTTAETRTFFVGPDGAEGSVPTSLLRDAYPEESGIQSNPQKDPVPGVPIPLADGYRTSSHSAQ